MKSDAIKNLSLLDLETDRETFTRELFEGLKEYGFVVIRDHGISPEEMAKTYSLVQRLFELPVKVKLQYDSGSGGARGYTAFGRENAAGNPHADLKEFWHVGQTLSSTSQYASTYAENVWPKELPEFEPVLGGMYRELENLSKTLLEVVGDALGLKRSFFDEMVSDGNSIYRLLHYPKVEGLDTGRAMRAAPHADINLLTLLLGATDSGLELLDNDGKWLAVESGPNEIVLDTGDMMSRLTNELLPSTVHRVVNPHKQDKSRYSMPFFLHPHSKADLSCLPQCLGESGAKYPPITAGEFLQQRLEEIGLVKG
ncbi:MAG: isopenicillin N synthase-like dioxygenase [Pseudohongiellaceae bacterium]|jgi:isopenicillin N synthase-like dioxygenase